MSKYTTELRYICERKAGLTSSVDLPDIDTVINQSWNKIFTTKAELFDEDYRAPLCKKIIKHFYFREIGAETAGQFLFFLNRTFEEIMPYYNQLYKTALLEFNPLYDVDYEMTGNNTLTGNESTDATRTSDFTRTDNLSTEETRNLTNLQTNNLAHQNQNAHVDLYHDTPQGSLQGITDQNYLTNARKITDNETGSNTGTVTTDDTGSRDITNTGTQNNEGTETNKGSRNINNTSDYIEKVHGKRGSSSYGKLLLEFRQSLVNIDMLVIEEFNTCFMGLY